MAQLTYVGQGHLAAFGPLLASAMLLVSLVFALLGIKFWGFRRRLTFDRTYTTQQQQSQSTSQSQQPPRYAAYESQVNGTDNAVHGVFRQRNTEEFESTRPTNSAGSKYLTGSVPNLSLASLAPRERKEVPTIPELAGSVPYRTGSEPQAARRRRRDVYSANYEYYNSPPTREPPTPPVAVVALAQQAANEPVAQQLDMPNFDHFAEKYELISAKLAGDGLQPRQSQLTHKENGRYVKYEQVDDVPELLTPDDDHAGAPISVAAMVHNVPNSPQPTMQQEPLDGAVVEPILQQEPKTEPILTLETVAEPRLELEQRAEPRIRKLEPQPELEVKLQLDKDTQFQLGEVTEPKLTIELLEPEVESKLIQKQEPKLTLEVKSPLEATQQSLLEPQVELSTNRSSRIIDGQLLPLEHTDSAFVVEIIAGTPDAIEQSRPVLAPKLFDDLELVSHHQDDDFELKRSSYEMNEADILDMQPDFSGMQMEPAPSSPPGFGKGIEEDWENFENLDPVTDIPEPNWSVHPAILESPLSEQRDNHLELANEVQQETLFQELELMEPVVEAPPTEPPPYEARLPPPPVLPDYESLMQQEKLKTPRNLPKYADVVSQNRSNGTKYVSSIEDLFGELNGDAPTSSSSQVRNFEELCEELEIAPSPVPARRAPQPAPRVSKPATLSARGDAAPLTCYEPEELPNSSSSEEETVEPVPQPAKRQRHVRFDVENLQYYQSAEVPSSNESEVDYESAEDVESETEFAPRTMQRLITLPADLEADVPRLFGTQVSQEESDDDGAFGRAIRQHRTMTEALRPVVQLERNSDRGTEA
ncbi:uncharacterized protein LOC133845478 [Drosophila sulfurigaster albostrigata]|uniref:uncharacterized protein LOC133845478 n=1 Tax=Drosophila sulfurigaster albostrigata TaxID=89887 RepID=UPI002D21899E|nr:uncharacterized protein LOC133845478 [Drosophila sulfurigaster albostrigata]